MLGNIFALKGQVQCFSMQVLMKSFFFLNLETIYAQIRFISFEKNAKTA